MNKNIGLTGFKFEKRILKVLPDAYFSTDNYNQICYLC